MIANVETLPESARQAFLLALKFQALASTPQVSSGKLCFSVSKEMAGDFAGLVNPAMQKNWIPQTSTIVNETPEDVAKAAEVLWTIGRVHLQKSIADGDWIPSEINLDLSPQQGPIVNGATRLKRTFSSGGSV